MDKDRRFIEESFPVKEVSVESAREKNIRHGHISTLHIWWARRPLASSRATNYAALIPAPENVEEWDRKRQFIAEFSKWENSLNKTMIQQARKDILAANNGKPPRVLDPFGGGGAIPLEALRLGCETYSNDLNPVAVLIQKCTLEYPQKYGKPQKRGFTKGIMGTDMEGEREVNPLLEDVKRWGAWVLEQAKAEIGQFYPEDPTGPSRWATSGPGTSPVRIPLAARRSPSCANSGWPRRIRKRWPYFPTPEGMRYASRSWEPDMTLCPKVLIRQMEPWPGLWPHARCAVRPWTPRPPGGFFRKGGLGKKWWPWCSTNRG